MSPSSHSGRHRSSQSRSTDTGKEDLIDQVKTIITSLDNVVSHYVDRVESYIPSAQSAMAVLDRIRFFREQNRFQEQVWIIQGLQDFAYYDADAGCIRDVAEWCQAAWLKVLRVYPESSQVLMGLGDNWLQRAQAVLAKIQNEESSESSNGSATAGNRQRTERGIYVEARGYLQPAVDFYARAVRAAESENTVTGDLLASAAQAQMSLGNVTGSPRDERYFSQAIRYLRRAEAIPGYNLSIYLQNYLDEYGRYVS